GPHSMARTLVPINWSDDEPFPFDEEEPPVASRKDEPRQDRQRDALFVASQYKAQALEDEADEDEELHPSWMKLVYIAAGLGLVAGLLVIFAGPPVRRALQTASFQAENIAYQIDTPDRTPAVKRSTPRSWRTILDGSFGNAAEPRPAEQVSPDLMMAQLTAPSRIPVAAKRPAPFEAPPPGLAPAAIEVGSSVPGILFSGQNKVTVVPGVSAISAGVAEGLLIHRTAPVYPMFARENNLSGTVFLSATITKTGAINSLRVLSGPSVFRDAAVNAVKTWRYKPYMLDKQPVDVETTISVVFKAREN
ncbi:MAG: energy transducer TonB, partial [Terriglobia bacterium]|nr:energy transducer TonB [Terriglobia bacterium]